jgi:hypothetical protein
VPGGHEDCRRAIAVRYQSALQVHPTHAWHSHIGDQTFGIRQAAGLQEPATAKAKARFILATDGADFEARTLIKFEARTLIKEETRGPAEGGTCASLWNKREPGAI